MLRVLLIATIFCINGAAAAYSVGFDSAGLRNSLQVRASTVEVIPDANQAILDGNVMVEDGDTKVNADHAVIYYTKNQNGDLSLRSIKGQGNIVFVRAKEKASGKAFDYNVAEGKMVLQGGVVLQKGLNTVYTEKYTYNLLQKVGDLGNKDAKSGNATRTKVILGDVKNLK